MELVNDSMHEIAKKTQKETVSMKIITVVTLFFLPGTFISVSLFRVLSHYHMTMSQSLADAEVAISADYYEY